MRTVQPATTYSVILIGHLDKGVVSVFIWRDGKLFCNNSQRTLLVIQQQRCFAGIQDPFYKYTKCRGEKTRQIKTPHREKSLNFFISVSYNKTTKIANSYKRNHSQSN